MKKFFKKPLLEKLLVFSFLTELFFLFLIFYKSEIIHKGNIRYYYLDYFYILCIVIFFNSLSLFFKRIAEVFIISLASIILTVYLYEFYLIFGQQNKIIDYKKNIFEKNNEGQKYNARTPYEEYEILKKKDKKFQVVTPFFLNKNSIDADFYPLSGISNSPTLYCNENGYYSTFNSDKYGFNNLAKRWEESEVEIIGVGDSFVLGACVNHSDDIISKINILSGKSVLNLGYGGNGPLLNYIALKEYANIKHKIILFFFYEGNDFLDMERSSQNNVLKQYLIDYNFSQDLKNNQSRIDEVHKSFIISERKKYYITKFVEFIKLKKIRNYLIINKSYNEIDYNKYETLLKKVLLNTKKFSKDANSKLYIVYLPEFYRFIYNNNVFYDKKKNLVKKVVKDLNIPFVDIDDMVFKKENDPMDLFPLRSFGHYNEVGYHKTARSILNFIENK